VRGDYADDWVVSYADFIFVAMLQCAKKADEDIFTKFLSLDDTFPKLYQACMQWLKED
jgi:hypothetical protein